MPISHKEWVRKQFEKNLRKNYRRAIIHASFIESAVRKRSKARDDNFFSAIEWLFDPKRSKEDKGAFHDVRENRNRLIHDLLNDAPDSQQIERWRDILLRSVLELYEHSEFLQAELFDEYDIRKDGAVERLRRACR